MTPLTRLPLSLRSARRSAVGAVAVVVLAGAGLSLPATSASAADAAPSPALHYAFDETSGASLADDSGNGYDGTLAGTGGTLADGALTLPGGASGSGAAYVSIPNTPFVGHQDVTVSVWLKNSTGAGNYAGAYVGNSATTNGYWLLDPDNPNGYLKSVVTTATTAATSSSPWSTELGPGRTGAPTSGHAATSDMALYTTVIDGTAGTESVYLDGELVQTTTTGVDLSDYGTASSLVAYLGRSPYADKFFAGSVDDYAVYDEALSADQVAALFSAAPSTDTRQVVTDRAAAALDLGDLSSVTSDLDLPTAGTDGTTVSWSSSDPSVLSDTGAVTQDDTAHTVKLTATVTLGAASTTRVFTAAVPPAVLTAADAAATLQLPYVLSPDTTLPAAAGDATVSWASSDTSLVDGDGTVVGTDHGLADVTLTATVALGDDTATRVFHLQVAEKDPAYAAGYTVTPGGMLNSSLHLALSDDGSSYTALNLGQGVLFAKADYSTNTLNGVTKWLADPYVFRMKDDTFGVIATRTDTDGTADAKPVLFTSPDLITYTEVGRLDLGADQAVSTPEATYDGAAGDYLVSYVGADGATYQVHTGDFTDFSTPILGSAVTTVVPDTGIASATVTDRIVLTRAESDLLDKRFSQVTNTTVATTPLSIQRGGAAPTAADLGKATASYSDGTTDQVPVDWSADDLAAVDTSTPGTYTVSGTVKTADYDFPLVSTAIADPDVFTYDGRYYLTGTTESNGQKALYMRVSDTIAGLATATPHAIYTDTSVLSWAPEVHEINGSWYLNWATGSAWNQVKSTVVKLTGTDPASASSWDWADAKTVTLADGSAIQPDGITLDMTSFQSGGQWYAVWSDRVITPTTGSANLKIAKLDPEDPSKLASDPVTISRPDYGWDRNTSYVDEGPNVLVHDGKVVITYSGSGVDSTYILATMSADTDADLLSADSWTKENAPELTSVNVSGQYGPGHNAYFTDLDGTLMTAFHAKNGSSGARSAGVRAVKWGAYGNLVLDLTGDRQVLPANRDVTTTVTVTAAPKVASRLTLKVSPTSLRLDRHHRGRFVVSGRVTASVHPTGRVAITVAGTTRKVKVSGTGTFRLAVMVKKAKRYRVTAHYLGSTTVKSSATKTAHVVVKRRK